MMSTNIIISKIEEALGFNLNKWQKEYLFSDSNQIPLSARQNRGTGKTTIYIIKFILTHVPPIKYSDLHLYSDKVDPIYARQWFVLEFMDIYEKLLMTDLLTVDIIRNTK